MAHLKDYNKFTNFLMYCSLTSCWTVLYRPLTFNGTVLYRPLEFDRYRYTDTNISVSVREYSNRYRYPPNLTNRTDTRYRYIGMIPIPGSYRYSYRYYIKQAGTCISCENFYRLTRVRS